MKPEDQIKALAELDGWCGCNKFACADSYFASAPQYLTSYDAIIPLIQKQSHEVKCNMWNHLDAESDLWDATPAVLCEALLRAADRWISS